MNEVRLYLNLVMKRFATPLNEVIENDIPLLLRKDTLKKANTYIDFANDEIIILNKEIPVNLITSGHYCIPIGKIVDNNHEEILKSESILFVMM